MLRACATLPTRCHGATSSVGKGAGKAARVGCQGHAPLPTPQVTTALHRIDQVARAGHRTSGGTCNLGFAFDLLVGGMLVRRRRRPGDDLKPSIRVLRNRGAAFYPVAAIEIGDAEFVVDGGVMDVTADHSVGRISARL